MKRRGFLIGLSSLPLSGCLGHGVELTGAGATFPAPLYARWRALFERLHPHIRIGYRGVGSGAGIRRITAREVAFGASDALLTDAETRALPAALLTIPTALGAVVLAYNLPKIKAPVTLSADVIAGMYLGRITRWSAPEVVALNPEIELPDIPVRVVRRADSSGTTSIFTDYLSAVSPDWRTGVGRGKTVDWPVGGLSGEGSDGLAHQVLLQPGGIGYVEMTYALNSGLAFATLVNREGAAVRPTAEAVKQAEACSAERDGLKPTLVNAAGAQSYPISAFTYILLYQDLSYLGKERAETLLEFLRWCLTDGQDEAEKLHYVGLPEQTAARALRALESVTYSCA